MREGKIIRAFTVTIIVFKKNTFIHNLSLSYTKQCRVLIFIVLQINFFTYIAKTYGSNPNIIYETFNEPLQIDWSIVKSYHEKVVAAIRKYDKKNLIVLGTTTWSQDVDIAAANPVSGSNLCYTLHYYAASHKQSLRDKAQTALNKAKICQKIFPNFVYNLREFAFS